MVSETVLQYVKSVIGVPKQNPADIPAGTVMLGQNNKYWIVRETPKTKRKKWIKNGLKIKAEEVLKKIKGGKKYYIHDNGGRPFLVQICKDKINIYQSSGKDYDQYMNDDEKYVNIYDKLILTISPYEKVFIGKDTNEMLNISRKLQNGNTILIKQPDKQDKHTYIFVGNDGIYSFEPHEEIKKYVSPIGNNDVPYPYAVDNKNYYLMLDGVYIPKDEVEKGITPYEYYYFKIPKHQKKKYTSEHKFTKTVIKQRP